MLKEKSIFNEFGDDSVESKDIINGNSTGLMNLNSIKYSWTTKLEKIMLGNFWVPEKYSLVEDKVTIKELTDDEMESFKDTLSFLIALDSMQINNIPNLSDYITAPEVNGLFTIQGFQEYIHAKSYQYILNELFSSTEREEIYNRWRTNPLLLKRNKLIASKYQEFVDNKTLQNFKKALAADFALEGIYFYDGFNFFYQLEARNKAVGVASIIRAIENDEVTHVSFFQYLIKEIFDFNNPEDVKILHDAIHDATEEEIEWGHGNYGDKILGISTQSTEKHLKWLANNRCKILRIDQLYKGFNENPYQYLSQQKRENFFETSVTEYSMSTAVSGWDDF
jgi:ribonucleoside-diphosphate reductase beta chain